MSTQIFEQLRTLPNKLRSREKWEHNRTALQFQAAQPPSLWRPDLILLVHCAEAPVNSSELVSDSVQRNLGLSIRLYHDQQARTSEQTRPSWDTLPASGLWLPQQRKEGLPPIPASQSKRVEKDLEPSLIYLIHLPSVLFCPPTPPPAGTNNNSAKEIWVMERKRKNKHIKMSVSSEPLLLKKTMWVDLELFQWLC